MTPNPETPPPATPDLMDPHPVTETAHLLEMVPLRKATMPPTALPG